MADKKIELQASFQPANRFTNYGDAILRLHIKGFRNHSNTPIAIESPVTAFCGVNGTGKSTILQLAAAAYKAPAAGGRYYVSTFILAGTMDKKPFADNASFEVSYAQPTLPDGKIPTRDLTVSRADSKWSGYDHQPERRVAYLGVGFHMPHSERDEDYKSKVQDTRLELRHQTAIEKTVLEKISTILLCNYDVAHQNTLRRKYARKSVALLSAKRQNGEEYSEANMGSGEARLYDLVMRIESFPENSLILIEEPETALHPSAQYELGCYLVEVSKRRKIQVFITTHSEYVLLALPQKSRIYLKRENNSVVPIPGIGVRQAISLMDNMEIPALYILVEDDVAEAIITELLRRHDDNLVKTVRVLIAGDKDKIQAMMAVFKDQKLPVCAVRDGDFGADKKIQMFKLFGTEAPEKEIFKSATFRSAFAATHKVDFDAVDVKNKAQNHHRWFDVLETQMARKRPEILTAAAVAYLDGVPENDRARLVEQIKASVP
jgi:predicted ATP-dependent endonuclease of OLD family